MTRFSVGKARKLSKVAWILRCLCLIDLPCRHPLIQKLHYKFFEENESFLAANVEKV